VTATVRKLEKPERLTVSRVPDIGLGMKLRDGNAAFNKALREDLARHDITFSQYQHLRQLWQEDGLAQVELSRRIGIETASSTAVIDQLEKLGFIRRRRDAGDRRRIIVSLTRSGRALQKPLDGCAVSVNRRARNGLTNTQVASLFDVIGKIVTNLGGKSREADGSWQMQDRGK
jgi:MarR family transcriptional regulator, organic hydroperoxide resistance regulator